MYKFYIALCTILNWRTFSVTGFNIETVDVFVKRGKESGSYFGYSVALHQIQESSYSPNNNWLLVGAPLGQNLQPNTNRSGALYKCPVDRNSECEQVRTDGHRDGMDYDDDDEQEFNKLYPPGRDEIKNNQWMGVSVKSEKPGGNIVVCAHRYIQSPNITKHHYGYGLCYILSNDFVTTSDNNFIPCLGQPVEKLHQQFGLCQVGTSVDFTKDGMVIAGTPGTFTWRGTIFAEQRSGEFLQRDATIYHGPFGDDSEVIEKYSYLGMSVADGNFFNKSENIWISGAPRANLTGKVYFFRKTKGQEFLDIPLILNGTKFGSSYGYVLLATDVNNDGYDDLLVSAPFYYDDHSGGKVYIYYNLRECLKDKKFCEPNAEITGKKSSRFGFSLTSLGDINKDGYNDVAIGAPYETVKEGYGAVYIYLGSKNGLITKESQVIRHRGLKTFGYSLSGGLDVDNNGYPDLLVGAYESDMAILYRTRPIIDIKISIKGQEHIHINATRLGCTRFPNEDHACFSFQSCFRIIKKKDAKINDFSIKYSISENATRNRIWFHNEQFAHKKNNNKTTDIKVTDTSKEYCQEETVFIESSVRDFLKPINFVVNYTLIDDGRNNNRLKNILNQTSVHNFQATFQKDCGADDICYSELVVKEKMEFKKDNNAYVITSLKDEIVIEIDVTNRGEPAYDSKLFVNHSEHLSYITLKSKETTHVKCTSFDKTLVACDLGNPLYKDKPEKFGLRFEVFSTEPQIPIHIFVNTTSNETSTKTERSFLIMFKKYALFALRSKSPNNFFYGGEVKGESAMTKLEDIGARVTHAYQIDNTGKWVLENINIHISWPIQVESSTQRSGKWLLYLEKMPNIIGHDIEGSCSADGEINVLKLNSTTKDDPESLTLLEDFSTTKSRRRRDIDAVVPYRVVNKNGKERKIVSMECGKTARCMNIVCSIKKLKTGNQATIEIRSRLWNSTLVEDYKNVDWVSIKSEAKVEVDKSFTLDKDTTFYHTAETIAYPEIVQLDSSTSLWIIIISVVLGLLLLIVLIVILYKCGFFKRHRHAKDATLSGNLIQKDETGSLLNKD